MNQIGTDSIIDLDDVFVLYRGSAQDVAALRGLSLHVRQGEQLVIHGPSGAGKSTFVKLITAAISPNAGTAWLFDHELSALDHRARTNLRRQSIGIITQHSGDELAAELTCHENVALQPRDRRSSPKERHDGAMNALHAAGVAHLAHWRPSKLSHGEQQRVGIAAAIANQPRLLVADEPTGQLDVATGDAMLDLLSTIARRSGATLIIATHDEAAARLADRVLTIADGRLSEERRKGEASPSAVVDESGWLRLSQPARDYARIIGYANIAQRDGNLVISSRHEQVTARRPEPREVRSLDDTLRSPAVHIASHSIVRRLRDVTRRYGEVEVLQPTSIDVKSGGLHAIVGRSGSGKSTLLSILSGWLPPTSGTVECPVGEVAISVAPAVPAFPEGLNVRDVLELTVRIQRRRSETATYDALLDRLGLADLGNRLANELSGGERQRLAIARCLIADATLLLLDEPTAQLDRRSARRVIDLLTEAAHDHAVVCATHDVELIGTANAVHSLDPINAPDAVWTR